MLLFLLELLPALLLGFWGGRRHPGLSAHLAMPLVRFGVPVSVMGLLLRGGLGGEMVLAAVLAVLDAAKVVAEDLGRRQGRALPTHESGLRGGEGRGQ